MSIDFRDADPFHDHVRQAIVMIGRYGTKKVRCAISTEALQQRFGATANTLDALFQAFEPNRAVIEEAASRKFESLGGRLDAVILRPADF